MEENSAEKRKIMWNQEMLINHLEHSLEHINALCENDNLINIKEDLENIAMYLNVAYHDIHLFKSKFAEETKGEFNENYG